MFQSDNASTISIIKDFITREATKRSVVIEMHVTTNDGSVAHTLRKLYPKVAYLVNRKHVDRLREAGIHECFVQTGVTVNLLTQS